MNKRQRCKIGKRCMMNFYKERSVIVQRSRKFMHKHAYERVRLSGWNLMCARVRFQSLYSKHFTKTKPIKIRTLWGCDVLFLLTYSAL